jgi:hypothetical protein
MTKILVEKIMSYTENQVFSHFLLNFDFKKYKKKSPPKKIIAFAFGWVFLDQN